MVGHFGDGFTKGIITNNVDQRLWAFWRLIGNPSTLSPDETVAKVGHPAKVLFTQM